MEPAATQKSPLRSRIQRLRDELATLSDAINEELDSREQTAPEIDLPEEPDEAG